MTSKNLNSVDSTPHSAVHSVYYNAEITQKMNCSYRRRSREWIFSFAFVHIPQHIRVFFYFFLSFFILYATLRLSSTSRSSVCMCVCVRRLACAMHTRTEQRIREREKNRNERQPAAYTYVWMYSKRTSLRLEFEPENNFTRLKIVELIQCCVSRCTLRTWVIRFIFKTQSLFTWYIFSFRYTFELNATSRRFACALMIAKWFSLLEETINFANDFNANRDARGKVKNY